ncbi:hypothetical protein DIPPA_19341 [Diplonema papillatum]|nr:hypothetical protein DIPPA_19341 [Diplonema papillatum]
MVRLAESTLHRMVVLKTALKAGWSVAADLQKGYHEEDEVPAYLRRVPGDAEGGRTAVEACQVTGSGLQPTRRAAPPHSAAPPPQADGARAGSRRKGSR